MRVTNVSFDFQRTGWVVQIPPSDRLGRFLVRKLENHPKSLSYIGDELYSEQENRAILLLNHYNFNPKLGGITSCEGLRDVENSGFEVYSDNKKIFVGLTKNEGRSWLFVGNGTEVMAREGHFIAGLIPPGGIKFTREECYYPNGPSLEEKLSQARDLGALVIPSHPLSKIGFFGRRVLRALKEPSENLGMDEETIVQYREWFDALEVYSLSMSEEQSVKARRLAECLDLPAVVNTDAPINSGMASSNIFNELDFSSSDSLRESIRNSLRERKYAENCAPVRSGLREKAKHILINFLCKRENF